MLTPNHNIIPMPASQPSTCLSLSAVPRPTAEALQTFAAFKGGEAAEAFGSLAMGEETERENQGAKAFVAFEVGLQKRLAEFGRGVLRNYVEERDRGPLRRDGQIFSSEATSKTYVVRFVLASAVPLAGRSVVGAG